MARRDGSTGGADRGYGLTAAHPNRSLQPVGDTMLEVDAKEVKRRTEVRTMRPGSYNVAIATVYSLAVPDGSTAGDNPPGSLT